MLEDCDIRSETLAGVGIHGTNTRPTLRRCRIHDGKNASVIAFDKGAVVLEDCEIWANACAGVFIMTEANPTLRRCKIRDGKSGGVKAMNGAAGSFHDCRQRRS
jgi:hypothetical protein